MLDQCRSVKCFNHHNYSCEAGSKFLFSLYHITGIFRGGGGVKFSWMLRFVVIRGKKSVDCRVRSKPHPLCTRRVMAEAMTPSFEVKVVVQGYHPYKSVWDAQVGYNTILSSFNHSLLFRSVHSILALLYAVVWINSGANFWVGRCNRCWWAILYLPSSWSTEITPY